MEGGTREKLVELLRKFDDAMLVTASAGGSMRSRPMALLQVEPDGDLWFMTSGHSGKIDEIAADSHVNVALQKDREYVSVCGRARVLRDRAKVDELWNEHMRAYFPNGKDDPDLVLLKVQAEEGEYWDNQGAQGLKYMFEVAKAYVTGTTPEIDRDIHAAVPLGGSGPASGGPAARSAR